MPIDTNLSIAPYFDDYSPDSEYYSVTYKPQVSVQARELNTMQAILRHQIEKFGDSIFQTGTIIDGCNFNFLPSYPYIKIKDLTTDGLNVTPSAYEGLFIKNTSNLQAIIIDSAVGFETTPPDLNTLYVSYRNSGNDSNTFHYSLGDVLTIYDSNTGIWAVTVNNAGISFSNSDQVVFTSDLAVNVTSGTFSNGDYVTQPSTGANLQIIGIDLASLATIGQVVLSLKPRSGDLSNSSSNGSQWALANNDTIRNSGNTAVGAVMAIVGAGATAGVVTDGSGRIIQIPIISRGFGYNTLPTVTVKSPNNASGVASLSLVPQNYVSKVTVSNTSGSVGNGYAFGVSEGTIYQKGLFLKVDAQTIIVDKYDQTPNAVSVGFLSVEQIINSNIDTSLLDNANGFNNYQAPGADRLKITPLLTLISSNTSSPDFLPIVSWSEGNPYRQNQTTAYSAIGDKLAQEVSETNGDFVLSRFETTTRSTFTSAFEGSKVSVIINPGSAYIKGYRVFNNTNYSIDIPKATDTQITTGCYINLNYGNWVRVKELGGLFQFNTGDTVTLWNTPKALLSNTTNIATANLTPVGVSLGTARVRSLVQENGVPGDPNASYRMYLFDILLNAGANFSDIRAIAYQGGAFPGICDVVLTLDSATNANIAQLANTDYDCLLFNSGAITLKNATNVNYIYRTIDQTVTIANTGILTKSIATTPNETFIGTGVLGVSALESLYLTPVSNNLIAFANATGTANALNSNTQVLGNSTTWANDFAPGDFIQLFQNSTVSSVKRVQQVVNNTLMVLDSNPSFTGNNLGVFRYFPQYAPIPLGLRSGLSANISANGNLLTVILAQSNGSTLSFSGSSTTTCALGVNIQRTNIAPSSKTAARDQFIRISMSNNVGGVAGPWCLGTSDVFRLKRVFTDTSNAVSNTSSEITPYFYIDHKQNEDYLDIGFLYLRPGSGYTPAANAWLLVQYDAFQASGAGYFDTVSYVGSNSATIATTDSTSLANLGSSVASWEIPEMYTSRGQYFDLMNVFDFRPIAANSASATTNSASSPINPTYSLSFGNTANPANDKKFPLPDSSMNYTLEQYMSRTDAIFCAKGGTVFITRGVPATGTPSLPRGSKGALRLNNIYLPPYPNLPTNLSDLQSEVLTTRIACQNYMAVRQGIKTILTPSTPGSPTDTQPRVYSMAAIGALDRRIQNLEYVAALSALQTDMVSKVIPSSVDGMTNRFKFGFFVDNFSSPTSQDVTNPSYAADISSAHLTPPIVDWVVGYGLAPAISVSYIDFPVITQPDATVPKPVANTPNTVIVTPNTTPLSANVWLLRNDHLAPAPSGTIVLADYAYPVFANVAGPATFYFYVPTSTFNPATAQIYGDPDNFYIYQGTTLIGDAYSNAVALTSSDIAYLQSPAVPGIYFNGLPLSTSLTRPAVNYVSGSGKISFTHNPSGGTKYTILSTRQGQYDHWWYGLQYPSQFGSDIVAPPSTSAPKYIGVMDVEPPTMLLALTTPGTAGVYAPDYTAAWGLTDPTQIAQQVATMYVNGASSLTSDYITFGTLYGQDTTNYGGGGISYFNGVAYGLPVPSTTFIPQSFGITVYGLRPSTTHNVTVNNILKNARCAIPGLALGTPLISDANGILRFNYFYDGNSADQDVLHQFISGFSSEVSWATEQAGSMVQPIATGSLTMVVNDVTGTSTASFTLQVVADAELVLNVISSLIGQAQAALVAWENSGQGSN